MAKYDFEEESSSDSDKDDDVFLRDEITALSAACLPSSSDDEDDDDLELVRSIKEQYGNADISNPLSLEPLTTLPPATFSDDDDDDFETLRAIQSRFSHFSSDLPRNSEEDVGTRETNIGSSCMDQSVSKDDTDNGLPLPNNESLDECTNAPPQDPCDTSIDWDGSSCNSSFPKAAQMFIEAIKRNRSNQKFIRSKLLHIEAKIEEIKELQKRVKTLKDFQVQCKRNVGRALSQKQDALVQLISTPKQKANIKGSVMSHGPLENSHVTHYKNALTKFPLSFHREKWSEEEKENLEKGIIQQFQEMLLQKSTDVLSALEEEPGHAGRLDSIISSITNVDMTPEIIQEFSGSVKWDQLASMYLPRRTGAECEARWLNFENRLINWDKWTAQEDKQLLLVVQQNGINNWIDIAKGLNTNRSPFQCLARYQRSLNASILKREWSEDEDAQLRNAVETFGDSNWQAVASALEGRTGTQCSNRWNKTLHPSRQRVGKFSYDEDKRLKVAVALFRHKNWHRIAQFVPGRTQVQCRERWVNILDPSVKWGEWTKDEDMKLKAAVQEHGCRWSVVATCVPMRTDSQCRRRWKRLCPHEVLQLQAAKNIEKVALISNFVDRESERPALGPNDFVPLLVEGSTNEQEDGNVPQKRKNSRKKAKLYADREVAPCNASEVVRSRFSKRARSLQMNLTSDCGDEGKGEGDRVVKNKSRMSGKSGSRKNKCSGSANSAVELKKKISKNKELEEIGEYGDIETWDMPVNIRSRRPRGVRSKAIHTISDCSVFEDTGQDDTRGVSMSLKQRSSELERDGSLTESTLVADSGVDSNGTCIRNFSKKKPRENKLCPDRSKEWEDLPLTVLFPEAARRRKHNSSSMSTSGKLAKRR